MKQVLVRQGGVALEEVPAPGAEPGAILVEVEHSCISAGTELSGVRSSGGPLWKKALRQPDKVRKALQMVATQGLARARSQIEGKLGAGVPTGYSAAGRVLAVGEGVDDLAPGDRVACAGAQCAHHAEIIRVPRNLAVAVPDGLGTAEASTVTLGAIALQGLRRAQPTLGETFVVLGLGLLGQLTVQLLKANGCRVVGIDLDPARLALAGKLGLDAAVRDEDGPAPEQVVRLTGGAGADGVIITAASPSDAIVSTAFRMCRKKGRVVLVGDVGLHLNRADIYQKELDFLVSTSYGPGRYDNLYEERGLEYPLAYVRWTENRNMAEYLRLVAEGKVDLGPLISATFPLDRVPEAYASLQSGSPRPLMVLLAYPGRAGKAAARAANPQAKARGGDGIGLAVAGAGGFAKGMHLPNLQSLPGLFRLRAVMSRTGHNAAAAAKQFGAAYSTTDFGEVLADPEVDAVLIATRHDQHAAMALRALEAGKHVLLEKPLALTAAEAGAIEAFYAGRDGAPAPILLTGFNRRFSAFARRARELVERRAGPMAIDYRMNAGFIPADHWVHGPEGGGRNLGEACHIYDLFTFLTGARCDRIQAQPIRPGGGYGPRDNFAAMAGFDDGSVATLTYTSMGAGDYPKERMEIFCDGKVLSLDDYRSLAVHGSKAKGVEAKLQAKGQLEELEAFGRAIRAGGPWPIPLWQQLQATRMALEVDAQLAPAGETAPAAAAGIPA